MTAHNSREGTRSVALCEVLLSPDFYLSSFSAYSPHKCVQPGKRLEKYAETFWPNGCDASISAVCHSKVAFWGQ